MNRSQTAAIRWVFLFVVLGVSAPLTSQEVNERRRSLNETKIPQVKVRGVDELTTLQLLGSLTPFNVAVSRDAEKHVKDTSSPLQLVAVRTPMSETVHVLSKLSRMRATVEGGDLIRFTLADNHVESGLWRGPDTPFMPYMAERFVDQRIRRALNETVRVSFENRKLFSIVREAFTGREKSPFHSYVIGPELWRRRNELNRSISYRPGDGKPLRSHLSALLKPNGISWVVVGEILVLETKARIRRCFQVLEDHQRKVLRTAYRDLLNGDAPEAMAAVRSIDLPARSKWIVSVFKGMRDVMTSAANGKRTNTFDRFAALSRRGRAVSSMIYDDPHELFRRGADVVRKHLQVSPYVERLIDRLDVESYNRRTKATESLSRLRYLAEEELRAHQDHSNPEVRHRVRTILDRLR